MVAQPGLGSNPSRDTYASESGVDPAVSNYSPVATLLNDNMKLNTSVFGMPLM